MLKHPRRPFDPFRQDGYGGAGHVKQAGRPRYLDPAGANRPLHDILLKLHQRYGRLPTTGIAEACGTWTLMVPFRSPGHLLPHMPPHRVNRYG